MGYPISYPAEAERPAENELLIKLDRTLHARAETLVDGALKPAIERACQLVDVALIPIMGSQGTAAVRETIGVDAYALIKSRAVELVHKVLVDQAIAQITGGEG